MAILVTSATSRNGSEAAKQLLDTGKYRVRLGARNPSKLATLATQGAEPVTLDDTLDSAVSAFTGVTAAYIILPAMVGGAEVTLFHNYLQAAKQTNTKHIVYLSGQVAGKPSSVHKHGQHEQLLKETGISFTVLRPTWFHENTTSYHAKSVKSTGEFKTSAGDGVWTSVAIADVAAVAVAALTQPVQHANKVYALQEEALTDDLLAEKISKAIGKKVTHVNLTPEEHKELLKKTYPGAEEFADAIVALDTFKRNSTFSTVGPDLKQVLGRKGITVDEFLAKHAQVFL